MIYDHPHAQKSCYAVDISISIDSVCVCVFECMCVIVRVFVCVSLRGTTERLVRLRRAWKEFRCLVRGFSRLFAQDVFICKKLVKNIHFFVVVEYEKFLI